MPAGSCLPVKRGVTINTDSSGSRSKHETLKPTEAVNFTGVTLCAIRDSQPLFEHKKSLVLDSRFLTFTLKVSFRRKTRKEASSLAGQNGGICYLAFLDYA